MGNLFKIIALTVLIVLVVFSLMADMALVRRLEQGLSLGLYVRLASLLGLIALVLYAWGYKRQVESSQKYQRADEVLEQAQSTIASKQAELEQREVQLNAAYEAKEAALDEQIEQSLIVHQNQINRLKEQNMELKDAVSKLMKALKAERANRE
jgi:hypothetical protein